MNQNPPKPRSAYQIFKLQKNANYPQLLLELIINPRTYNFERVKAEYLLETWIGHYLRMSKIQKYTFEKSIPRTLQLMLAAVQKHEGMIKSVVSFYLLQYENWPKFTRFLSKGIKNSSAYHLKILWSISFHMVENYKMKLLESFGGHLSAHFEEPLSFYKWHNHPEKVKLLQIIKHINCLVRFPEFINNSKRWVEVMMAIISDPFKSEYKKTSETFSLYQYEKQLNKSKKQEKKKGKDKSDIPKNTQKKEITVFLRVDDEEQEQILYKHQIQYEASECLYLLDEKQWQKFMLMFLRKFNSILDQLSMSNRFDRHDLNLFQSQLKHHKVRKIIFENMKEELIVNVIRNLSTADSPFKKNPYNQILDDLDNIFSEPPEGQTRQEVFRNRIRAIMDAAYEGKDDIINRAFMQICKQKNFTLSENQVMQIVNFISCSSRKNLILMESYLVMTKIFLNYIRNLDKVIFNTLTIFVNVPHIINNNLSHVRINEYRLVTIQVFGHLLNLAFFENNQKLSVIDITTKFLEISIINFDSFEEVVIFILDVLVERYPKIMNSQISKLIRLFKQMNRKLLSDKSMRKVYSYFNSSLKATFKLKNEEIFKIYDSMDSHFFDDEEMIVFRRQIEILKQELKKSSIMKTTPNEIDADGPQKLALDRNIQKYEHEEIYPAYCQDDQMQQTTALSEYNLPPQYLQIWNKYFHNFFPSFKSAVCQQNYLQKEKTNADYIELIAFEYLITAFNNEILDKEDLKDLPNEIFKEFLTQTDEKLLNMFESLDRGQMSYQMYSLASKLYVHAHDFDFLFTLKSFNFIKNNCFYVLSMYYNKPEVLAATSLFSGLLLIHIESENLKSIYNRLNENDFLIDLFKGADYFIGMEKDYYPNSVIIFLAYQLIKPYREERPTILQPNLYSIENNSMWWVQSQCKVKPDIPLYAQSKLVFYNFELSMQEIVKSYYFKLLQLVQKRAGSIRIL